MPAYAVVWTDSSRPASLFRGSLGIGQEFAYLDGADDDRHAVHHELAEEGIVACRVSRRDSLRGTPSLRVTLRNGRTFLIGCVLGAPVILEICDAIADLATHVAP